MDIQAQNNLPLKGILFEGRRLRRRPNQPKKVVQFGPDVDEYIADCEAQRQHDLMLRQPMTLRSGRTLMTGPPPLKPVEEIVVQRQITLRSGRKLLPPPPPPLTKQKDHVVPKELTLRSDRKVEARAPPKKGKKEVAVDHGTVKKFTGILEKAASGRNTKTR